MREIARIFPAQVDDIGNNPLARHLLDRLNVLYVNRDQQRAEEYYHPEDNLDHHVINYHGMRTHYNFNERGLSVRRLLERSVAYKYCTQSECKSLQEVSNYIQNLVDFDVVRHFDIS